MRNGVAEADIKGPLTHSVIEVMPVEEHNRAVAQMQKQFEEYCARVNDDLASQAQKIKGLERQLFISRCR